ncbi:MAG: NAD(P)-dependent oxidoreductase [Bacteroidota bacterium]
MPKIGILREGKIPIDKRVPVTPKQARYIKENLKTEVVVQTSEIRCFTDEDYRNEGIQVVEDLTDCDLIMGVKEVPIELLIPNKTYFFFSHTIKKQEYNRALLRAILEKNIQLIDWETLTNESGNRIIAFGRWAGIVGAYNGLWTYGKRYNSFHLRRAHECFDLEDLRREYKKVDLPPVKVAITGGGRVAKGAMEVLNEVGIRKVTPYEFLNTYFDEPVFAQLNSRDYTTPDDDRPFSRKAYYNHPETFQNDFLKYSKVADVLLACAFWHPKAPVLFTKEDALRNDFAIRVIADITCDIEGSIPSTKKPSTIEEPVYDYNPSDDAVEMAMTDEANITVMAVDNLPCELPRDASESFGDQLIENVLPYLLGKDEKSIIKQAVIAENGKLTEKYSYLQDYVDGR